MLHFYKKCFSLRENFNYLNNITYCISKEFWEINLFQTMVKEGEEEWQVDLERENNTEK